MTREMLDRAVTAMKENGIPLESVDLLVIHKPFICFGTVEAQLNRPWKGHRCGDRVSLDWIEPLMIDKEFP